MKRMMIILVVLVAAAFVLNWMNARPEEPEKGPAISLEGPKETLPLPTNVPSQPEPTPIQPTQAPQQGPAGSSGISGYWGEQMTRARNYSFPFDMDEPKMVELGYTYPLVFDEALRGCTGFTLDYKIVEIVRGNLEGNFRFEVLVRTVQGEWKSADTFRMDGYSATVEVELDQPRSVDAVAVVCGKQDEEVTYCFDMAVRDPIC